MQRYSRRVVIGLMFGVVLLGCCAFEPVTVRVLSYNIRHGEGVDQKIDLERIAEVIRRVEPDLVALQEVDRGVERTSRVDQPAELAKLTGMHSVFERNITYQGGDYGNAILSRHPIEYHKNHYLPKSLPQEQRGTLEVRIKPKGRPFILYATHLDYHGDDGERLASVALLKELLSDQGHNPVIVAGDMNCLPDSEVMRRMTAFLRDSYDPAGGDAFTFPADKPVRRIDFIMDNRHSSLKCIEYRVIDEPVASDHRPLLAVYRMD